MVGRSVQTATPVCCHLPTTRLINHWIIIYCTDSIHTEDPTESVCGTFTGTCAESKRERQTVSNNFNISDNGNRTHSWQNGALRSQATPIRVELMAVNKQVCHTTDVLEISTIETLAGIQQENLG